MVALDRIIIPYYLAMNSNVRRWTIENLIVLAADPVLTQFPYFKRMLASLLEIEISNEDWNKWLEKNASLLGDLPNKHWLWDRDVKDGILTELPDYSRVYITYSRTAPAVLGVKSSSFLQSHGAIPSLWIWSGEYEGLTSEPLSKDLAHYDWLIQSAERITGGSYDPSFNTNIQAFVIGNMARLNTIRQWFKYEPKYIGGGADGVAWDIGDRKIMKLFSDTTSYNHALQAAHRLHKNPSLGKTEAMIYDVGIIGQFENYNLYYYIMEKMVPVTEIPGIKEELRHLVTAIVSKIYGERELWRVIKKRNFDLDGPGIRAKVKEYANKYAREIMQKHSVFVRGIENTFALNQIKIDQENPDEHLIPLSEKWLPSLVEEVLMKYLTGRGDLHMGNLGVTAYGEFRYFDPAYEGWNSNINMGGGLVPQPERRN